MQLMKLGYLNCSCHRIVGQLQLLNRLQGKPQVDHVATAQSGFVRFLGASPALPSLLQRETAASPAPATTAEEAMPQQRGEPEREELQQGEPPAPDVEPWAAAVPPVSSLGWEKGQGKEGGPHLVQSTFRGREILGAL